MGTYLATLHSQGVALWGGEEFQRIAKFAHPGVQYIDFSPCERFASVPCVCTVSVDPFCLVLLCCEYDFCKFFLFWFSYVVSTISVNPFVSY